MTIPCHKRWHINLTELRPEQAKRLEIEVGKDFLRSISTVASQTTHTFLLIRRTSAAAFKKKPDGGDEVMQHFKNILTAHSDNTDIKPNQVCVIGDRLLTDILLGNRSGMHTVLVHDVISLENDNRMAVAVG